MAEFGDRPGPGPAAAESGTTGSWWDWRLLGTWVLINAIGYAVIVVGGTALEALASSATRGLVDQHRWTAVMLTAAIGATFQALVLGRWQWRVLHERMARLRRRRWVLATLGPALVIWSLVIGPAVVDILAQGGATLRAFRDGFAQALVLGPLIGAAQAAALRDDTSRWFWWFAGNLTTYLSGAALYRLVVWLQREFALPGWAAPYCPVLAFALHGVWMLWISAPVATRRVSRSPG
ncbi:MAG TPA: hypothetical protein VF163_05895 [Micromonosporaceae bacterium]